MRTRTTKWYEVGAKVAEMQEDGTAKPVMRQYVVDAMSFTEAESNATAYLAGYYQEFEIVTEKIARFSEVHMNNKEDSYFKITIELITLDEKTGKEKHTKQRMLVEGYKYCECRGFRTRDNEGLDDRIQDCDY